MKIFINQKEYFTNAKTLKELKKELNQNPEILIIDGFACNEDEIIEDGSKIFFLKKDEIPTNLNDIIRARNHPFINKSIKNHSIGIAGVGGLGSTLAISLARVGLNMNLVDFDIVDITNLNRQQYQIQDIAKFKTDALKEHILKINPNLNIKSINTRLNKNNLFSIFKDCSIICECFDDANSKKELIDESSKSLKDKIIISTSGMAGWGKSLDFKILKFSKNVFVVGDLNSFASRQNSLMAPRVGICANIVANLVLEILTSKEELLDVL